MKRRLPILLLVLMLALPGVAAAAGKISLLPTFVLFGEWTDNFLLTPENDPDNEKIDAFSVNFQPGLRLRHDTYRSESFVYFAATFRHVFEHEDQSGWPEYYNGGLGWSYWINPRWRTTVGDELMFVTDPRDQPFSEGRDLETLRTESIANRIFASSLWQMSRIDNLEGGYAFATTEFREDDVSDTVEHQVSVEWAHQFAANHRLFVFYAYNRALYSPDFDFLRHYWDDEVAMDPGFPTALDDPADFDTHIPGVGLEYLATASLSFQVRSGLIVPASEPNGVYQLDELEWYQRMEVTQLFWRMRAGLVYNRTFAPAHGLEGGVVTNAVSARVDEQWLRQLETYQEGSFTNYLQDATDLDAWRATAAINYYPWNWFGVGAAYNYLEQFSYAPDGATDARTVAHRVTLRLGLTSPRPDWLSF
ncbi:MAG: hypothetical protein P9L99_09915 [Candidatus Lernaella stagnicola]|nr:hypothetical protein [Candidatus Lernaella stagnicola]